jgi:excisionase family DNA binding protein
MSQILPTPVDTGVDAFVHFEPLLDCDEAARFLRIHPSTVKRYARTGRLPGFRVGNRWRFRPSELDDWARSAVLSRHSLRRE